MDDAPLSALAAVCRTAPTPAGLANCSSMFSAGTAGTTGGSRAPQLRSNCTLVRPRPVRRQQLRWWRTVLQNVTWFSTPSVAGPAPEDIQLRKLLK